MKVLIVEDEIPAAEKLERYLQKYNPAIEVADRAKSVSEAVSAIQANQQHLDLIFMDIQLIDGLSFEIFDQVKVTVPVIFTTAFDEYAVDAFKVNSVAYLLKPITFKDLSEAMKKLDAMKQQFGGGMDINSVLANLSAIKYKERFMVKVGDHIKSIKTEDIALFFADGRVAYLLTYEKRKFIIDYKLEELEELLDPTAFFRLNRTFIVNINAIADVLMYSNSRLKVTPSIEFDKEMIVSRDKVTAFKDWFSGI